MSHRFMRTRRLVSSPRRRLPRARRLWLEPLEPRQLLTAFQVTTELDIENAGDGLTSLREAVILANETTGADTITFAPALANQPVLLLNGAIGIKDSLTIQGLGSGKTTVDAQDSSQIFSIFTVSNAPDVTFVGLTLTRGKATGDFITGGAISSTSTGHLTIQNSVLSDSATTGKGGDGGGVFASGSVTILSSTISGNSTAADDAEGGGISAGGAVTVTNSTISGNFTLGIDAQGGGIESLNGTVTITNSTISGNSTAGDQSFGGGISANNTVTVTNSTIFGNSTAGGAGFGGGIFANSTLTVTNSTIAKNFTTGLFGRGGGLASTSGPVTIRNSIVADNLNGEDRSHPDYYQLDNGTPTVQSSLIGDNNGTLLVAALPGSPDVNGNLIGTHDDPIDPMLRLLANNGGSTRTQLPLLGSPVIDAGNNSLAVDPVAMAEITSDQRGFLRIRPAVPEGVSTVDMGAVEFALPPVIGSFGSSITYAENAAPLPIASTATLTDPDSSSFLAGKLMVRFSAAGQAEDRLLIRTAGNISTSGNEVRFAGIAFGTFTGGTGVTPLVVTFGAQSSPGKVQGLLRNIAYRNTSQNPNTSPRTVGVQLTDGNGGISIAVAKQINVTRRNDAPVLAPADGGTVGYQQNTAQIALLSTATVTDPDSPNFSGGKLLVRIISGGNASNRLRIGGGFELDGDLLKRTSDGLVIGSRNAGGGVGTTRLEITFNADATRAVVQQLVRGIRFRTESGTSTTQRVIEFSLTDGNGGASNKVNKTVNVSSR